MSSTTLTSPRSESFVRLTITTTPCSHTIWKWKAYRKCYNTFLPANFSSYPLVTLDFYWLHHMDIFQLSTWKLPIIPITPRHFRLSSSPMDCLNQMFKSTWNCQNVVTKMANIKQTIWVTSIGLTLMMPGRKCHSKAGMLTCQKSDTVWARGPCVAM